MYQGRTVFSQILDFLPRRKFKNCVDRYQGNYRTRSLTCFDQFVCMAFAQLTYRDSLRDTVLCLDALRKNLYHSGIKGNVSKSTLADANEKRDWRIYADFAQVLIKQARALYVMDRAYLNFERLYKMHLNSSFFILRSKRNTKLKRIYSAPVDRNTGVICDQTVRVVGKTTAEAYPEKLRRVKYKIH